MSLKNVVIFLFTIGLFVVCSSAVYIPAPKNATKSIVNSVNTTNLFNGKLERTFIMIKPDAVQRGLIGKIIERFETKGFKLVAMKFLWASKHRIGQHYEQLKNREFYSRLLKQMVSGPVVPMVWEGLDAVRMGRKLMGSAEPNESLPGTIRGDFSIDVGRSILHGSHSVEAAAKEIKIWFNENELVDWIPANAYYLNELFY